MKYIKMKYIKSLIKLIISWLKFSMEDEDDRLKCPNCSRAEWAIRNYSEIQCSCCYRKYHNLGELGLQRIYN